MMYHLYLNTSNYNLPVVIHNKDSLYTNTDISNYYTLNYQIILAKDNIIQQN